MDRVEIVACTNGTFDIVHKGEIKGNATGLLMAERLVELLWVSGGLPTGYVVDIVVGPRRYKEVF